MRHCLLEKQCEWYKNVHTQSFIPADQVFVLNLRQYKGRFPKWIRRYSHVATVKKKINDVTYQLYCAEWRQRYRLIHVDKLKLCTPAAQSLDSAENHTNKHNFVVIVVGGPIAREADFAGNRRTQVVEGSLIYN